MLVRLSQDQDFVRDLVHREEDFDQDGVRRKEDPLTRVWREG